MIKEDYVSFETAMLLKEKGFNEKCREYYVKSKECGIEFYSGGTCDYNTVEGLVCSAPTLQRVMKWLREVHHLHIEIGIGADIESTFGYMPVIYGVLEKKRLYGGMFVPMADVEDIVDYTPETYEKAAEEAIRYCLEKLI